MKINGFDHVEYYVGDLTSAVAALRDGYGFLVAGRSPGGSGRRSVLLKHGQIRLLLTEPPADDDAVAAYLARHGDGVAVIAFATDDVTQAFTDVITAGAIPLADPAFATSGDERVGTALVAGFGDVTHKLVERSDPDGEFAPGVIEIAPGDQDRQPGPAAPLDDIVRFYRDVFGLAQIYDERIEVGAQAMASKVVQDHDSRVTFTLIEPDTTLEPGQIDEFLAAHDGAGVQHLAFRTSDIAEA